MNQQTFRAQWNHIRQLVGIANRLVEAVPESKLDSAPIAHMRTVKELVAHAYGVAIRDCMEGLASGELKESNEKTAILSLKTRADLLRYCDECWTAANRAAETVTDEKLKAMVKTPWGHDMPGAAIVGVTLDEFLHHRGQLYAYLRTLGCEVPMMWDFEHNAPGFQPAAHATA